jgi:hypothetical protein
MNFHNVELRATEKARSSSPQAIAPYIDAKRKQRSKVSGHDEYVTMDSELVARKQTLAATTEKVRLAQEKLAALQSQIEATGKRTGVKSRLHRGRAKRAPVSSSDR